MLGVPIYLFTGFLESGKTTFIKGLLKDDSFIEGERNILILCEEGEIEYDERLLKLSNTKIIKIEKQEDFTESFLVKINNKYKPERVLIEYNCMWNFNKLMTMQLPKWWEFAEIITTVNESTFKMYMNNMRSIMAEQFKKSDLVLFNRCQKGFNKIALRGSVKAVNQKAQLVFELVNGQVDTSEPALPFNMQDKIIEIKDYDFGLWYVDINESPKKYIGKKIKIKGRVGVPKNYPEGFFVLGRRAMTCCEEDITLLAVLCKNNSDKKISKGEWIEITGTVHYSNKNNMPVIVVEEMSETEKPEQELIYFY